MHFKSSVFPEFLIFFIFQFLDLCFDWLRNFAKVMEPWRYFLQSRPLRHGYHCRISEPRSCPTLSSLLASERTFFEQVPDWSLLTPSFSSFGLRQTAARKSLGLQPPRNHPRISLSSPTSRVFSGKRSIVSYSQIFVEAHKPVNWPYVHHIFERCW